MTLLTKSKYLTGTQCPRLLWLSSRKLLPEVSLSDRQRFSQGHEFETYAHKLFPKGVNLGELEFNDNIKKTSELVKKKKTIFEAGIQVDDLFLRADVLEFDKNGWNLYEIKASTKQKPQHIPDLAFQKYVLEKSGLVVKKCFVIFLNKEFIKKGKINSKKLCVVEDVTEKVDLVEDVEKNSKLFLKVMEGKKPGICISKNCNKPYVCAVKDECWGTLPKNNVLLLTNWRVYWKLFADGVVDMKDIPEGTKLNAKDRIILEGTLKNKVIISKEKIKQFLKSLKYPLCHLDFETFDTAVPMFDKSRPYQKMPFQYSVHIQPKKGKLVHYEFLSEGGDPRVELLKSLKKHTAGSGSVIVFNKSFEIGVLKKLLEDFPKEKWISKVLLRIIDLADVFKNFYYYNPSQKGSYSIKKILPAVTGESYSALEIANGADASALYFISHVKKQSTEKDIPSKKEIKKKSKAQKIDIPSKKEIRSNLLKYCGLDTEGMVWVLRELEKLVEE
tara:strand:+ start:7 stop:1509 length:1503 start_codon:yes stop_codon:yes gene_type:complete